jgi:proline dehydrogenase
MLRSVILAAARSPRVERLVETAPVSRDVVRRFVAGTATADALRTTQGLVDDGLAVSIDHLGEDTLTPEQAEATRDEYLRLLAALAGAELTPAAEVSLKLSALGQRFDEKLAYDHARAICVAASEAGTTVTLDMEDHGTTDSTLEILGRLRVDFPTTGAVLQAQLRRSEGDCRELAAAGSRVRLCKGAYREPETVAFQSRLDIDKSYVRCLNILMSGEGYPCSPPTTRAWSRSVRTGPSGSTDRRTRSNSRCSSASGPRSRSGWRRRATRCVCTFRTERSGTAT